MAAILRCLAGKQMSGSSVLKGNLRIIAADWNMPVVWGWLSALPPNERRHVQSELRAAYRRLYFSLTFGFFGDTPRKTYLTRLVRAGKYMLYSTEVTLRGIDLYVDWPPLGRLPLRAMR